MATASNKKKASRKEHIMKFEVRGFFNVPYLVAAVQRPSGEVVILTRNHSTVTAYQLTSHGFSRLKTGGQGTTEQDSCDHSHRVSGVAIDPVNGQVFVTEDDAVGILRDSGCVEFIAGDTTGRRTAGDADGLGPHARFSSPTGLAFDPEGRLLVIDYNNNKFKLLTRCTSGWHAESIPDPQHLVQTPYDVAYNSAMGAFLVTQVDQDTHDIVKVVLDHNDKYTVRPFPVQWPRKMKRSEDERWSWHGRFENHFAISCDSAGSALVGGGSRAAFFHITKDGHATAVQLLGAGDEGDEGLGSAITPLATQDGRLFLVDTEAGCLASLDHGGVLAGSALDNIQQVAAEAAAQLGKSILQQQQAGAFCDVTFDVGGEHIGAHRNVLAARSEYFATRFSTSVGVQDSTLPVHDTTVSAFRAVLGWLYTGQLDLEEEAVLPDVLLLTRQYLLRDLEAQCTVQLEQWLANISNVVRLLIWADHNSVDEFKQKAKGVLVAKCKQLNQLEPDDIALLEQCPKLMFELMMAISAGSGQA